MSESQPGGDPSRGTITEPPVQRPPGAADEATFHDACRQCGDCAEACPEGIISHDRSGHPFLNFSAGACTFFHSCTDACDFGALSLDNEWVWRGKIEKTCLSVKGELCRSCEKHCDQRAIAFHPEAVGPVLDEDLCNGCGGCTLACPVGAISFKDRRVSAKPRS